MSLASTTPRLQSERTAHRARRYRSCGYHLQARTASHTPGEERTLERFRTPSVVYGLDALITRLPFISWRPVKDATKRLHTVSPSFVPQRAFNATVTSLGLDAHDFAWAPRCVRPTSAIHYIPYSAPALMVPDLLCPSRKERCDRRIRRFTTRWIRFGGPCGRRGGVLALAPGQTPFGLSDGPVRFSLHSRLRL
jgi:hypothetical protein